MDNQIRKKRPKQKDIKDAIAELLSEYGETLLVQTLESEGLTSLSMGCTNTSGLTRETTLKEACEYFLQSGFFKYQLAESSKTSYRSEVNLLKGFSKPEDTLSQIIDPIFLGKYLKKHENVNTRNKKAAFLRAFLKVVIPQFAKDDQGFFKKFLSITKSREYIPKAFSHDQITELLSLIRLDSNLRNYAILITFLGSGLRVSQLVKLQIKNVDFNSQTLWVTPKGYTSKFPRKITKSAIDDLKEFINFTYRHISDENTFKSRYIFSTSGGEKPMTVRNVQHLVKELVMRATTISKENKAVFSCHNLRHTFAIRALEAGIDIYTIAKLLGHESIASTQIYLELYDHQLKEAIENHPFAKTFVVE